MIETYIVSIRTRNGQRFGQRHALQVPRDLALGRLERLSDLQLREATKDLAAERARRDGLL